MLKLFSLVMLALIKLSLKSRASVTLSFICCCKALCCFWMIWYTCFPGVQNLHLKLVLIKIILITSLVYMITIIYHLATREKKQMIWRKKVWEINRPKIKFFASLKAYQIDAEQIRDPYKCSISQKLFVHES